jgi:quinol monooxygenase YgiN
MYARSTSINGDPAAIDAGIACVRDEIMPEMMGMDGCVGLSMVVDRESGRCIATSSWRDEDAMRASGDQTAPYRSRVGEILGGSPEVDEWEVAMMHRDHASMSGSCCRITWARTADLDGTLDAWRMRVLPQIEATDGFCSASMLVDRAGGITCATVNFDSRAALDASREMAAARRETATQDLGIQFLGVSEFDLVLAHLRVPELV